MACCLVSDSISYCQDPSFAESEKSLTEIRDRKGKHEDFTLNNVNLSGLRTFPSSFSKR